MFVGTRISAATLIEYLEGGESLDELLEDFTSVGRDRAIAALKVLRALFGRRATAA